MQQEMVQMWIQRIDEMEQYILQNKTVTLDELCKTFKISKNTVRRDMERLLARGSIKKIYGGVSSCETRGIISFNQCSLKNSACKKCIARQAAALVRDGDTIFIDSGTTTVHMLSYLKERQRLTILTNHLQILMDAVPYFNIELISLSGTLMRETLSFGGESAAEVLRNYNINKAFMTATGISIQNGLTNSSVMELAVKAAAVSRSNEIILLADSSKFGAAALRTYCALDQVDTIVTDRLPSQEYIDFFQEHKQLLLVVS